MHYIYRVKILKFISAFVVFGAMLFSSCKNDLKLNAPYKEIPSIYAVLNPQEQLQMIRINKVFLGEGDANQMAQVADSVNYPEGELSVTLTHSSGTVTVFKDSLIQTASGAFSRTQRVYLSREPLKKTGTYTLTVKNNKTGNIFTSHTEALDSVRATGIQPFSLAYTYTNVMSNYENPNNYFVDYSGDRPGTNGENNKRYYINSAKIYQFAMRMYYYDYLGGVNSDSSSFYVDYNFGNQYATNASGGASDSYLLVSFTSPEFFTAMGVALKKQYPDGKGDYYNFSGRKIYKIQYFIYSSTQDYWDYLQYASPSLSISQNKSLYSNFDNRAALGIFTFRSRFSVDKAVSTFFMNAFANNANTKPFKFLKSDKTNP